MSRLPLRRLTWIQHVAALDYQIELVVRSDGGARAEPAKAVATATEPAETRKSRRVPPSPGLAEGSGEGPSSTAFSKAARVFSIASCGRSRVMKTMRVRRSALGHSGSSNRRVKEVLHPVQHDRLIGRSLSATIALRRKRSSPRIVASPSSQPDSTAQEIGRSRVMQKARMRSVVAVGVGVVVVVRVAAGEGLVAQPAPHIDTLGRGIEEAEIEQQRRIDGTLRHE